MRIPALLLLLSVAVHAQNVAVKWWASEPTNSVERVQGIPTNWPAAFVSLGASTNTPGAAWELLTHAQYTNHLALHRPAFLVWQSNYVAWQQSNETFRAAIERTNLLSIAAEVKQLRQEVQDNYANWTNLTAVEKLETIRKLLRLESLRDR